MARLGEVLIERGLLSQDGLRAGLDACRRNGGRLGTWLVRLGLINEAGLLEALTQLTGCPSASALELTTAPAELRGLVPPMLARRHLIVPFGRSGRTLEVAMANPNDLVLVDEITRLVGATIRPHVATEAALTAALTLPTLNAKNGGSSAPPPGPPAASHREWRQFWKLESAPSELMRALDAPPPPYVRHAAASFPFLTPLGEEGKRPPAGGPEDLADSLSVATHRDQVAALVLRALVNDVTRVALFSVHHNKVMAWAGQGLGLIEDDFHSIILPLDRPSIFLNLSQGAELHVGPLIGGEGNALLLGALGTPVAQEAVVVPLRVRGKMAGFLWVDRGDSSVAEVSVAEVREVGRLTGLALEILVLRQKVKSGTA